MRNKGITLIALVITIIVLLILAGIAINLTLGEHGILNMAKRAGIETEEQAAREKLELVLLDLQAKKYTDQTYNETTYIDTEIGKNGMAVEGDIVIVDGWQFTINRNVPEIGKSIGKLTEEARLLPTIIKVETETTKNSVTVSIKLRNA